jgi:hypothetical protein
VGVEVLLLEDQLVLTRYLAPLHHRVVAGEDRENLQAKQQIQEALAVVEEVLQAHQVQVELPIKVLLEEVVLVTLLHLLTAVEVVVAVLLVKLHPHQKEAMVVAAFFQTLLDHLQEGLAAVLVLVIFQPKQMEQHQREGELMRLEHP